MCFDRCAPSLVAFADRTAAAAFAADHGGTLRRFAELEVP
jgi:nitrous oxide reductase accessory protein NosL